MRFAAWPQLSRKQSKLARIKSPTLLSWTCSWPRAVAVPEIADSLRRRGRIGVLYATGHISTVNLTSSDGEALLSKPYRPQDVVRALEIVEQITLTGGASKPFPKGFSVLAHPFSISSAFELTTPRTDEFLDFPTTNFSDLIRRLRLQQAELLNFSNFALSEDHLDKVMTEATRLCTACLGVLVLHDRQIPQ